MEVLKSDTEHDICHIFLAVTCYAYKYFDTSNLNLIEFWNKILSLQDKHVIWKPTTLLVEIYFLCSIFKYSIRKPFQSDLLKTTVQNRYSLNSFLHICISEISLGSFHNEHLENCVKYWFNATNCHLGQYVRQESKMTKRQHFNISDISSIHLNQRTKLSFVFYFLFLLL